ncbi:MAG: exodeoxyribonuclease VII small subunit [Clostridia bacterium]|nr:exodeoxyribonuclease VII small subunit [Clostridia bacterium]
MATVMKKALTFEQAKAELDTVVERLSVGSLPLDEMVKLYEHGSALSAYCKKMLDAYDARLMLVDEAEGNEATEEEQ